MSKFCSEKFDNLIDLENKDGGVKRGLNRKGSTSSMKKDKLEKQDKNVCKFTIELLSDIPRKLNNEINTIREKIENLTFEKSELYSNYLSENTKLRKDIGEKNKIIEDLTSNSHLQFYFRYNQQDQCFKKR